MELLKQLAQLELRYPLPKNSKNKVYLTKLKDNEYRNNEIGA